MGARPAHVRVGKSELEAEVTGKNNMGVVRGRLFAARTFTFQKQGGQRAHLQRGTLKEKRKKEKTPTSLHHTVWIKGLVRLSSLAGCEQRPLIVCSPGERAGARQAGGDSGLWRAAPAYGLNHSSAAGDNLHAGKRKSSHFAPALMLGGTGWPAALLADTCSSSALRSTKRGNAVK